MGVNTAVFGRGPEVGDGAVDPAVDATFPEGFLLAVCRMIELKGLHYLVRAFPKIRAEQPALGLVLIGDGPERPRLEEEVGRLGLADAVRFVGRLPHGTVAAYVRQCRVAVVPSIVDATGRTDGMPTVIPEAMAAGARVVASRVGGIPDVVRHGENGWLARERDPDDLARQILLALDDGPESSVVREARETARQLDWRQVAENYLGYFEEALCEVA
jgi:glycosyltransferase involved in cell wall biosynthesis